MLSEINVVGGWFKSDPEEGWFFDEISFDERVIQEFNQIPLSINFLKHSARIEVPKTKNHCYIPSQYFLYAVKLQPLVALLSEYMDIFEQVKNSIPSASDFHALIHNIGSQNDILDKLDTYSRDNFVKSFISKDHRLAGKDIINDDKTKGKKYRTIDDFMTSILLKALPVPDASSAVLGDLMYAFSKAPKAYETLMERYSQNIPYLFKCSDGDEIIFRVLSYLGWNGKLELFFESNTEKVDVIDWVDIEGAFKFSETKIPGNIHYLEEPIHYSKFRNKYVHVRKNLLNSKQGITAFNNAINRLWPVFNIYKEGEKYLFKSSINSHIAGQRIEGGYNKIIYGAPGTGKSHGIEKNTDESLIIRTVFHPETQYSDFVGCLKPVMEEERVAYRFRPGPFAEALLAAVLNPNYMYSLVIEEINRAPAAAVFGELFQLLDRAPDGSSRYKINLSDPDLLNYLNTRTKHFFDSGKIFLPSNLTILSTMNSSDQAVMPLDTAFKRRWYFEYTEPKFDSAPEQTLELSCSVGLVKITWSAFAEKVINTMLKGFRVPEDRLIGPHFLNKTELVNWQDTLRGKLFVYLWDDVLRHKTQERARLFLPSLTTYSDLYKRFPNEQVFGEEADALILEFGTPSESIDG